MTDRRGPDRTETTDATETSANYRPTLGEVSHTNPYTGEVFGATRTYGRGRVVAADGGADPDRERRSEAGDDAERDADAETMQDVDHTPPDGSDGAAPVYERGNEGKTDEDEDVR